jgi:serine/threonine-protein kinase
MTEPNPRPLASPPPRPSSGTRVRSPRDLKVGEIVEGYELLSVLAAGATAVFTARRTKDDRRVVFRTGSERGAEAGEAIVANEAAFGLRVDHPQVVRVLARGTWGDRPYVVREHVAGLSLQTVLDALARRSRRLEAPLAGMVVLRIARAVAAFHEAAAPGQRGLLHGDLHPSNILVSSNGHVKLADFGSVRPLPLSGPTPPAAPRFPAEPYASPEQMDGRPVDERSEIFALAAILVRLLAGHEPPVHRPIAAWAFDVLVDEPPALRRLLASSLDRDPSARPASARAFADALAQAMPAAASWTEADLVRSLRGSPKSEPVVGLRASTPPPPPPQEEPISLGDPNADDGAWDDVAEPLEAESARAEARPEPTRSEPPIGEATRPLRLEERRALDVPRDADTTARTLLDRALEKDPTPTPRPLPAIPIDGVGDAPVPLFRFVAFFAAMALVAFAAAATWYFTR